MIRRERGRPRAAAARMVVPVLCCALVSASGGAAFASDPGPGGVVRIGADVDVSGMHSIDVPDIAPGYQESWSVTVVNERAEPVTVGLRVEGPDNDDNGCSAPEALKDDTCGAGNGELGAHLRMHVGVPENERLFSSTLDAAGEGSGQILTVPGGGEVEVVIGLRLPAGTGNVVQTDSVGFTLVWRAEAFPGTAGAPAEGGVEVRSDAAGSSDGGGLAMTGARVMLLVGVAMVLLAGGALLVVVLRGDGRADPVSR
ncbi:hypothetical protein [Actinorugispora endophytica]|uniref:Uncharacterized protein n=1 Tax=Actinorugispora endophytica TaxID=1605990 RepID=A0A4V3D8L1_9ACTN|nr:hypothetical protein [Actinorugispora endophytica]TDQ52206.1 hypothetical protein EV190_10736 [Actinorugispora endophytica]